MRKHRFALVVVCLLAASCADTGVIDPTPTTPGEAPPPTPEGSYQLIEGIPVVPGWPITMTIEGVAISGRSACNSYGAVVDFDAERFAVGELSSTAMGCEEQVMDAELAYLDSLSSVGAWEHRNGLLVLSGGGADLVFEPLPALEPSALIGTTWTLDSLMSQGVATTPVAGTQPTLRFDEGGTFEGSTGCRTLTGRWVPTGATITVTELSADGECPQGLLFQDGRVIAVLESFTPRTEGATLTLTAPGDETLVYRATDG